MNRPLMVVLFSCIGCGSGQIFNQQYFKGAFFIIFGVIINNYSHLNKAILLSFEGNIHAAIRAVNYQWGLYYLSFYLGSMYEAYIEAYKREYDCLPPALHASPVILGVSFGVIGIIYGRNSFLGPVLHGLLFTVAGVIGGILVIFVMRQKRH